MTTAEIILAILSTLLGAGNVWQLFTLRAMKRKSEAEADQSQVATLNQIIKTYSEELATLQARYDKLYDKYDALTDKYDALQTQFFELRNIIGKTN